MNKELLHDMVTTDDKSMVLIECLLPGYRNANDWMSIERALLGEAHGKWRIVRRGKQTYETQVMEPERPRSMADRTLTSADVSSPQTYETKGVKKKTVGWVQDSWIRGGAEISNELVIRVGTDCGFDIKVLTPQSDTELLRRTLAGADIIILNNIRSFSQAQMAIILKTIYSDRKPYVKYEHDHRELDRPEFSRKLFQNSAQNIFLSPVHLGNHRKALGCDGIAFPLAIDTEIFRPVDGIERRPNTALICNLRNFKKWTRLQDYIDEHTGMDFTVLAGNGGVVHGANVKQRNMVPYEEMPKIYSAFECLVHLLDGWGAGERVIFEAALAGCKIVSSERSGHMSWEKDLTDVEGLRAWLKAAPYQFWKEIDKIL
jgi:hypothetical protein